MAQSSEVAFRREHQAGITTASQDRLLFASFDVRHPARLPAMLRKWTVAAERLMAGKSVMAPAPGAGSDAPTDTGEVLGVTHGRLTLTIGYGGTLFDKIGLPAPALLRPLPAFPGDAIDPRISAGDIAVQACADDPQITFHAIRALTRLGRGVVAPRWLQSGFGRTSSTSPAQMTPRNLMGFKDGTRNIRSDQTGALEAHVWADADRHAPWLDSFLVARKIRMHLGTWDDEGLPEQEATFGRHKASGAPLGQAHEFDAPDFARMPRTSHVRLVSPEQNGGVRILRRGYSFADGLDSVHGHLHAGLFFLAYMADPAQFVHLQQKLAAHDDLNEYIEHVSSSLFAVPAGLAADDNWARQLYQLRR